MSFKSIQSSPDVTACVACLVSLVHAIIWIWSLFLPSHPHIAGWGIGYQIGYCCTSVFSSLPIYSLIIQQRGHCHHYPAVKTAFFVPSWLYCRNPNLLKHTDYFNAPFTPLLDLKIITPASQSTKFIQTFIRKN